jgi:hypothetical protein
MAVQTDSRAASVQTDFRADRLIAVFSRLLLPCKPFAAISPDFPLAEIVDDAGSGEPSTPPSERFWPRRKPMPARQLLSQVMDDEALTRGLGDEEARVLVEWLVERVEAMAAAEKSESEACDELGRLRRRARSISRFVTLWCHSGERGAAGQFAAAERLNWPLPDDEADPCDLMQVILEWEDQQERDFGGVEHSLEIGSRRAAA